LRTCPQRQTTIYLVGNLARKSSELIVGAEVCHKVKCEKKKETEHSRSLMKTVSGAI